ncbi:MAG: phytanoyl-CoA dioxygenase family protein [Planctomycetes bacterium]|nr:phytanoyl-CoA dioxygenase family protein [Planctomycetota bacterium]
MAHAALNLQAYRRDGFLSVENLLSPELVGRLQADLIRICRGKYACKAIEAQPDSLADQEVLERFLCIHHCQKISPVMLEMVRHPALAGVLTGLIGPDVKCMQSMLFIKPPGFPGQSWHQDELYIPTRDRSLTGAWIALDDATVENGCLWVVPRSHASGYLYRQREQRDADEFDFSKESYGFDETRACPVEVKAGTVIFFNGYLLHRSMRNRSARYRRVLVNHYMNAHSLLPWCLKPEELSHGVGQADYRDVVMVAGHDPYADKGVCDSAIPYLRGCKILEAKQAVGR